MDVVEYVIPHMQMLFLPRILETIAIRECMDIVAIRRYKKQVYYIAWYPVFVLWMYMVSALPVTNSMKLFINMLFILLTLIILYENQWYRNILIAAVITIGNRLFDIVFAQGFVLLMGDRFRNMESGSIEMFCMVMLTKLTEMLIIKIARGIVGYRRIQILKKEDYFLYFLMPIVSILMMDVLLADCIGHGKISVNLAWASLGLVVLDIAIFHMMHRMEAYYRSEGDLRALNSRMEAQMDNIASVELTHKRIRQMSHGITTQLSAIETLLRHQKYQEAEDYLKSITDTVEQDMLPIHTNNVVVDALLNQKYILARSKDIKMQFDIQDLQNVKIHTTNVVTILSNGLNNAIEACEKVDGERRIELKIINNDAELLISIQNTVAEDIKIEENIIPTSKEDKFNHGLGLEGIATVVERCDGKLFLECEGGIFKLVAVL